MRRHWQGPRSQQGIAAVETAIVAAVVLIVLFAVFEVARLFFVSNALEEATRRGARVAAVCQVNDPAIQRIAVYNTSGGTDSPILPGLTTANISVRYISSDGVVVADPVTDFLNIDAVSVTVQNYRHELIIPFLYQTILMPRFEAIVPRESLGVTREGYTTC